MRKIQYNDRDNEVECVKDRNFLDTIMEFEKQLESTAAAISRFKRICGDNGRGTSNTTTQKTTI